MIEATITDPETIKKHMREMRRRAQEASRHEAELAVAGHIPTMERSRGWTPREGVTQDISSLLGEFAPAVETILADSGTVAEIGAGNFETSSELATQFPNGSIIAIEPFPNELKSSNLPPNIQVIAKKIEDITPSDLQEKKVQCCFGAWVIEYATDKLAFIKKTYDLLDNNGVGFIYFGGGELSRPSPKEIIEELGLSDVLSIVPATDGGSVLVIKKVPNRELDFSNYQLTNNIDLGKGFCSSVYQEKPTN